MQIGERPFGAALGANRGAASASRVKVGAGRRAFWGKGGRGGDVSREPLKMGWFLGFVCGRKPVAAIHGLRYALGMRNFKYSGIGGGGLMYTSVVREIQDGNP